MDRVCIKGIVIGLALFLVLSGFMGFLFAPQIVEMHEEIISTKDLVADQQASLSIKELIQHPLYLPLVLMLSVVTVGIPGYISAYIAKESFIIHAISIGIVAGLLQLYWSESVYKDPYILLMVVLDLGIAYLGGHIRKIQVMRASLNV